MFEFINNKQQLVSTNYWDSEHAARGYYYLSWNAGAARLLVPASQKAAIKEMKTAKYVIISHGIWNDREALELLFEDGSDDPYVIHLVTEQTDRIIPDTDQGESFTVAIWTKQGKQLSRPGKYRHVETLPYLKPWI